MTEEPGKCGNSSLLLVLTAKDSFVSRYSKYIAGVLGTTLHKTSELSKVTEAILARFPLFWILGVLIVK